MIILKALYYMGWVGYESLKTKNEKSIDVRILKVKVTSLGIEFKKLNAHKGTHTPSKLPIGEENVVSLHYSQFCLKIKVKLSPPTVSKISGSGLRH